MKEQMKHTPFPWREGKGCGAVVSDSPNVDRSVPADQSEIEFYGGHLVFESCTEPDRKFIIGMSEEIAALRAEVERLKGGPK